MKRQQFYLFIGMLFIGFAYTNCGQAGNIELKSIPINENLVADYPADVSDGIPNDVPADNPAYVPISVPPDDPVHDIIVNCRSASAGQKLKVLNQKVNFEDTRIETRKDKICVFANSGQDQNTTENLSPLNNHMQARYEQSRKLDLPAGAVICDIEMKNDLQKFRYDDVFFFSFNGHLLATNNDLAIKERLTPTARKLSENSFTDIYQYDWIKLRGAFFENKAHDYCAGASEGLGQCSWPVSQTNGEIKFSFAQSLLVSMSAGVPSNNQTFSFVITGDNDPTLDCYHEKLEFAMTVKYYIPETINSL